MNEGTFYDKQFYETNKLDLGAAEIIMTYVYNKLKPNSVIDFGCGSGTWLSVVAKLGCQDILGIDGEYVNKEWLLFDKTKFRSGDLTKNIDLKRKYDMAISLEVAEHIAEKYSETYLTNLTKATDIILFSAAVPYQGGTNHVNEQFPSYWIEKFAKYGFVPYDALRWKFWNNQAIAFWYRQNIMFFVKKEKLAELKKLFPVKDMPTDLVHPVRIRNLVKENEDEMQKKEEEYTTKINNLENEKNTISHELSNLEIENKNNLEQYAILQKENKSNLERCENLKKVIEEKQEYIDQMSKIYKPKVSVVVPVFNVKNYLRECLDSILSQTLKEIEVLCGDGGSNDGSLEILREYEKKDKRVKVISREGSGYGQSVNECMDIAKGEYIGLVESDDKVDPKMYETLYNIAKQNDLDWIRSDIYHYYSSMPKDQQLKRESIIYGADFYHQVLNPKEDIRPYKSALHTWAGIYKREFLNRYHIRHHETPGGSYQDVGFYLRTLYEAERVYFFDKPFYYWRQDNPGSSIHYDAKKLIEKSFKEWELNKEYLKLYPNANERIWGSFNYRRYYSYMWTIEMANELKDEATEFAKKELNEAMQEGLISRRFFDDSEWEKLQEFLQ